MMNSCIINTRIDDTVKTLRSDSALFWAVKMSLISIRS